MNETEFLSVLSHGGTNIPNFSIHEAPADIVLASPYRNRIDERHPGIDYQSVISMELLEDRSGDVDVDLFEARNDEVIKRISEMNQIVVDAETYLSGDDPRFLSSRNVPEEYDTPEHHPIKAADSLLLLTQAQNEEEMILVHQEKPQVVMDEEISPSESDTDSTPNDSPLHRSTPIRNSINSGHPRVRRDSSFGLHSPDLLPGLSPSSDNIMAILKSLQTEEIELPFAEGTLYLDPDIIDLTMIPPPVTPDKDTQDVTAMLEAPPSDFVDVGVLQKELERWIKVSKGMIEGEMSANSCPFNAGGNHTGQLVPVDSARVVADLDNLCDALSEMKGPNSTSGGIDSYITGLHPPAPSRGMVHQDDLSAFIIPPPPSSSPSTEAQNEVIARFMAAAEDMRKMFGNSYDRQDDVLDEYDKNNITPTAERGFAEIHRAWPSPFSDQQLQAATHFQKTLSLFDKFGADSEFHSGDSSGYDTLTSSLTSYGEAAMVEDVDSTTFNSIDEEIRIFDSIPSSNDSTPVVEHAPTSLLVGNHDNGDILPVQPHTKTSCVDAMSPASLTSPSSTTSSDSSVILADATSNSELTLKLLGLGSLNKSPNSFQTGSCDNLPTTNDGQSTPETIGMSRSISWTSMTNMENPLPSRKQYDETHMMTPKPPIPPNPFQQSRLRKSFRRGPIKGPAVPRKPESIECQDTYNNDNAPNLNPRSRSPSPSQKFPDRPINGFTQHFVPKMLPNDDSDGLTTDEKLKSPLANGCIQNFLVPDDKQSSSSDQDFPAQVIDALSEDGIYISRCGGPFQQAQRDISTMIVHLKKLNHIALRPKPSTPADVTKFNATKEALVNESRQFVTSSKLFVKSAMETSDKMIENMAVCVALLNRMFAVSELVIMHMCSREQVTFLIEKLRDVALAYLRTVDAAHRAIGTDISNPQMGHLMHQATTLATTLTSLMRTLRVISPN